jgi:succinate dehydrogenase flavin-adding protein (antitoxin of CptAB toxin-antitoxin module)
MDPEITALFGKVATETLSALQEMRALKESTSANQLTLILSGYIALIILAMVGLRYLAKLQRQERDEYKALLTKKDKDLKEKDTELKQVNARFQERMESLTDKHIQAINDNIKTLQAAGSAITSLSMSTTGLATETREAIELYRDTLDKSVTRLEQAIRELKK